jgi:hypothetical protein
MSLSGALLSALLAIVAFLAGRFSKAPRVRNDAKAYAYRQISLATESLQGAFLEFVPTGEFQWGEGSIERWRSANLALNEALAANRFVLPSELIKLIETMCWLQPRVGDFKETLRTVGWTAQEIRNFVRVDFNEKSPAKAGLRSP